MIQNPNSVWVETLKVIYFPRGDFWNAGSGRGSSWAWKSLLHGRNLLKVKGRWNIATGCSVDITDDNWLANGEKATILPSADGRKVNDLIDSSHNWDVTKLRNNLSLPMLLLPFKHPYHDLPILILSLGLIPKLVPIL